jgi:putative nucleotidyltransferase with HDIG domain
MEKLSQTDLMVQVENFANQYLSQGRKDWDMPHTKSVAFYAEEIAKAEGLDVLVLKTAAWLHDIGYYGLFEDSDSSQHAAVKDKKEQHMINGARMASIFLSDEKIANHYTGEQIERIVHLVGVHDKLTELSEPDEIALMEADTLGAIDITRVAPTFDKESGHKYITGLKAKRLPLFKSEVGKQFIKDLLPRFEAFFDQ